MLCGCAYLGCGLYCGRFVIWLGVLVFVWLVCGFVGFCVCWLSCWWFVFTLFVWGAFFRGLVSLIWI